MLHKRFNWVGMLFGICIALCVLTGCQGHHIEVPEGYTGFSVNNVEFALLSENLWTTESNITETNITLYQDNKLCAVVSTKPYGKDVSASGVYDLIKASEDKDAQQEAYKQYLESLEFPNPEIGPKSINIDVQKDLVLVKTEWDSSGLKKKFDSKEAKDLTEEANRPGSFNVEVFGPEGKYMLLQFTNRRSYELTAVMNSSMEDALSISCMGNKGMTPLYELGEVKETEFKKIEEENKRKEEQKKRELEEKAEKLKDLDSEIANQEIHHVNSWVDPGDPQYPNLYPPSLCVSKIVNNTDKTIRECTIAFAAWDSSGMYVNIEQRYGSRKSPEYLGLYDTHIQPKSEANLGLDHCWQFTDRGNMVTTTKAIVMEATFHDGTKWDNPMYDLWREKYLRKNLE